jgi:esterase
VATLVAQEHPELVRRLVVEDVSPPPQHQADSALPTRRERLTFALQSSLLLTRWRRFDLCMVRPVLDEIVLAPNPTWWQRLPSIAAPTLLVRGEHGQMAADRAAAVASLLPDCSTVTIAGARHRVHSQHLDEFALPVLEFLARS